MDRRTLLWLTAAGLVTPGMARAGSMTLLGAGKPPVASGGPPAALAVAALVQDALLGASSTAYAVTTLVDLAAGDAASIWILTNGTNVVPTSVTDSTAGSWTAGTVISDGTQRIVNYYKVFSATLTAAAGAITINMPSACQCIVSGDRLRGPTFTNAGELNAAWGSTGSGTASSISGSFSGYKVSHACIYDDSTAPSPTITGVGTWTARSQAFLVAGGNSLGLFCYTQENAGVTGVFELDISWPSTVHGAFGQRIFGEA